MDDFSIQLARKKDHLVLSEIARKAKGKWGYPEEWLDLWKNDLVISPEHLEKHPTYNIILNGGIIGFCSLGIYQNHLEVLHLWILPDKGRNGYGKALLSFSLNQHLSSNISKVVVESDPNAASFYEKFGFRKIRMIKSIPEGRELPYMEVDGKEIKKYL